MKARLGIVGNAPGLIRAVDRALRVAPIDVSVLVTGESGTGKEFFPRIIHAYSPRKHSKYIAVNCGALPEGTIDSELFGHEKGAFTGAIATRKGYFEEADGGTIFLDEVGELPLTTQARLLRVLETGEFMKVGSSTVQKTNLRVVAATNVDMLRAVSEGRFREDLYYRLATVSIEVPPLRERGNDTLLLTRKFIGDFDERYRTEPVEWADDARHTLLNYRWPGNVRQLKNVVEQVALFEAGTTVTRDTLAGYLPAGGDEYSPVRCVSDHTYERERDMLLGMIMNLQSEIDALKSGAATAGQHAPSAAIPVEKQLGIGHTGRLPVDGQSYPDVSRLTDVSARVDSAHQPGGPVDVAYSTVDHWEGGLSLEDTERETIRLALQRNDGRRKAAAAELHISERTLYRKIKEYGLQ